MNKEDKIFKKSREDFENKMIEDGKKFRKIRNDLLDICILCLEHNMLFCTLRGMLSIGTNFTLDARLSTKQMAMDAFDDISIFIVIKWEEQEFYVRPKHPMELTDYILNHVQSIVKELEKKGYTRKDWKDL